ncbi:hypothetical protein TNCV_5039631 [Trichonephila clavipes]|nr:hypothetical protein TNCV_5039631 [Trichonephila clavipes]
MANIGFKELILCNSASFKGIEVCAAFERDACPDRQVSTALVVNFMAIGRHVVGWFRGSLQMKAWPRRESLVKLNADSSLKRMVTH